MFGLGVTELILILVLVLLIFGPRKLPELGGFLGKALRDFRDSLDRRDDGDDSTPGPPAAPPRDRPVSDVDSAAASADPNKPR